MSDFLVALVSELQLGRPEKEVLRALCHSADDIPSHLGLGIDCYPSIERISWKTDYSRRQVQISLRKLEKGYGKGAVAIPKGVHPTHGTTEYEIDLNKAPKKPPFVARQKGRGGRNLGVQPLHPPVQPMHPGVHTVHPESEEDAPHGGATAAPGDAEIALGDAAISPNSYLSPIGGNNRERSIVPSCGDTNNAELTYRSRIQETFAQLPGASQKPADPQIVRKWFSEKVPAETVEAALWIGAMRHGMGPNHTRTLSISYFLPVVEECLKTSIPPKYVEYIKRKIPDIARDRAQFEETVTRERQEDIARERRFQEVSS